jgi:hypothetical protein
MCAIPRVAHTTYLASLLPTPLPNLINPLRPILVTKNTQCNLPISERYLPTFIPYLFPSTLSPQLTLPNSSNPIHCIKGCRYPCPQPECHEPNSPWPGIIKLFPARESLVSDIPAGDGKNTKFFYSVPTLPASLTLHAHPHT